MRAWWLALALFLVCVAGHPCTYSSPQGHFYDFSPVSQCITDESKEVGYVIPINGNSSSDIILINVCSELKHMGCGNYSGVSHCSGDQSSECTSFGTATSGTFRSRVDPATGNETITLQYTGGSMCTQGEAEPRPASALITWKCTTEDATNIIFSPNSSACVYEFEISSPHACARAPGPQNKACPWPQGVRNVYLVPHSHDDVGWNETPDQYYTSHYDGSDDQGPVQKVLDNVFAALQGDPSRTFTQVEQEYFSRWWEARNLTERDMYRTLVRNGQVEFAVGGWVMHDEATPTYSAMVDQMTEGHLYLKDQLGVGGGPGRTSSVEYGWQIDPFGHSAFTPDMNRLMGFKGHVMYRIDDALRKKMIDEASLQFSWNGMPTSVLVDNYAQPFGELSYRFGCHPPDAAESLSTYMAKYRGSDLTPAVLVPYGTDFGLFKAQERDYPCLDQLIEYMRANFDQYLINIRYATPRDYFSGLLSFVETNVSRSGSSLPGVPQEDFLPYTDKVGVGEYGTGFWTGFYSSRPALKRLARQGEALCRQVEVIYAAAWASSDIYSVSTTLATLVNTPLVESALTHLRRALARVQHHDGITGTAQPAVVDWYSNDIGTAVASTNEALQVLSLQAPGAGPVWNQGKLMKGGWVSVANSLGWDRVEWVMLPLDPSSLNVTVTTITGTPVPCQVHAPGAISKAALFFQARVPALGHAYYLVQPTSSVSPHARVVYPSSPDTTMNITAGNSTVSISSGALKSVTWNGTVLDLSAHLMMYDSYEGYDQYSGAYIFRPNGEAYPLNASRTEVFHDPGANVTEVIQEYTMDKVEDKKLTSRVTIRLYQDLDFVEMSFDIFVPSAGNGRELVVRLSSAINSSVDGARTFWTDSNGAGPIIHRYDSTIPGESFEGYSRNYYPIVYHAGINDSEHHLSVVTDTTHGGSSLDDGDLELMLHRRTLVDDGRGLGEVMDDSSVASSTLRIGVGAASASTSWKTNNAYLLNYPLTVMALGWAAPALGQPLLATPLPPSVHLMTLRTVAAFNDPTHLRAPSMLVRLKHLYSPDDGPLGQPVLLDIGEIFPTLITQFGLLSITTLTGTQVLEDRGQSNYTILLEPQAIVTFRLGVSPHRLHKFVGVPPPASQVITIALVLGLVLLAFTFLGGFLIMRFLRSKQITVKEFLMKDF